MESATGEIKMPWSEVEIETEAYETCLPYLCIIAQISQLHVDKLCCFHRSRGWYQNKIGLKRLFRTSPYAIIKVIYIND